MTKHSHLTREDRYVILKSIIGTIAKEIRIHRTMVLPKKYKGTSLSTGHIIKIAVPILLAAHDCPYHRRTKTAHAMACNASMVSWETIPFAPTSTCSLKTGALNLQNQMKYRRPDTVSFTAALCSPDRIDRIDVDDIILRPSLIK